MVDLYANAVDHFTETNWTGGGSGLAVSHISHVIIESSLRKVHAEHAHSMLVGLTTNHNLRGIWVLPGEDSRLFSK